MSRDDYDTAVKDNLSDAEWLDRNGLNTLPDPESHDFESERNAAEGGLGPCAVCGQARSKPVHT